MNLLRFDSEAAWANTAASLWRDRLRTNPRLRMCLPSGHTPNRIYASMGQSVRAGQVTFRDAEIFALDDYGGLAPDDEGKCANMLRRYLVGQIDLPADRFHTLDTDAPDLEMVCQEYDALIGEEGFDLVLLGIGLNGHLGMNEPGSPPDSATRLVELADATISSSASYFTHRHLPTWGIGVGLDQLLGAKEIWLLANGSAKAEIIRQAMKEKISVDVPASLLREHPNSYLLVDAEAGALL